MVTLVDVAEYAGVSASTASRALNGRGELSSETRAAVLEAADALQFQPSHLARSLRTRTTFTVGFVVPDVSSPFYASALKGAQVALEQAGYRVMLMDCEQSADGEVAALRTLLAHRVDGLLLSTVGIDARALRATRRPHAACPASSSTARSPDAGDGTVLLDNNAGIELLVDHLVAHGHRSGSASSPARQRDERPRAARRLPRRDAQRTASTLQDAHVGGERWTQRRRLARRRARSSTAAHPSDGARLVERRARARLRCSLAGSSECAIPDDVALATFDDAYFAELLDPPLTAVAYDPTDVGRDAAELLVEAMQDGEAAPARRHGPGHARHARDPADVRRERRLHRRSASRGVSKRYGSQLALQPTDLEIAEGEFFCLLGPSGCGKTTTLNLIGGFVNPTSGEIYIRDQRVDALPPHRRSVNTVFQSYALFPHMTVRGERRLRAQDGEGAGDGGASRIDEALALVGLEEFADRLPGQLSGGQQQRVAVARALVNRPAVLLLDEPLGALDLKLRKRLQLELAQIHRDVGTTFVYVTHDQEEAMSMATRIAVMNQGRIAQIGTPSEIYYVPRSQFVADFIGESNFLDVDAAGAGAASRIWPTGARCPARRKDGRGGTARP